MVKILTVSGLLVIAACSSSHSDPHSPATEQSANSSEDALKGGPVGTKLVRDVTGSEQTYEIGSNQGNGLGSYAVRVDGKPVWPPQGEGCDQLTRCCTELASLADSMALSCLLAAGRDRDCRIAIETVSSIAGEQGQSLPATCRR